MYIKNRLSPGDWALPIPVGIKVALQYNERGQLQTVYTGWGLSRREASSELFTAIRDLKNIPLKIHIEHATSMVSCVLYTASLIATTGPVPEVVLSSLIEHFIDSPDDFSLWGAIFETTAAPVATAIDNQRALIAARFTPLPQYLLPHNLSDVIIDQLVGNERFPFTYPLITDWLVYKDGKHSVIESPLSEFLVNDLEIFNDENGYVHVKLTDPYDKEMIVDYSMVLDGAIHSGSLIFLNEINELVHVEYLDDADTTRSLAARCAHCGCELVRTDVGMRCSNMHCTSLLKPQLKRMVEILRLPDFTDEVLTEVLENMGHLDRPARLSDLFDYAAYKDKKFDATLIQAMSAVIPMQVISNISVYKRFNLACGGNMKRIMFYIDNPGLIAGQLSLTMPDDLVLSDWLSDSDNRSNLKHALDHMNLKTSDVRFDGAPIFRDKHICITGQFIRGTQIDISSILQSYSAKVTMTLESDTDMVLVGGQYDGIDGQIVAKAREALRPVYSEDEFFSHYEIDEDLKQLH